MSRRRCDVSPPEWSPPQSGKPIELHLRTITPLFGGGHTAREVDPLCVIRPAAIRGHLRFWWRATAGAQFQDPQTLFEEEEKLWGSAAHEPERDGKRKSVGPSLVSVEVCGAKAVAEPVRLDGPSSQVPDYFKAVLIQEKSKTEQRIRDQFPGKNNRKRREQELDAHRQTIEQEKDRLYPFVVPAASFRLKVTVRDSSVQPDVARAIKAFLLFGGVGGRSRRGYGCLDWDSLDPDVQKASLNGQGSWLDEIRDPPPGLVSVLGSRLYLGCPKPSAIKAWDDAARTFHHFRKAELPGRKRPYKGTGSHTTWPEADMIRRLRNPAAPVHNSSYVSPVGGRAFPRAQLGLPLKFQSERRQWGSFGEAELYLEIGRTEVSRLASPVIVKPVRVKGQWHPAILILKSSKLRPADLKLRGYPAANPLPDCTGAPAGLWDGTRDVPYSNSHSTVLDVLADYLTGHARWTLTGLSSL